MEIGNYLTLIILSGMVCLNSKVQYTEILSFQAVLSLNFELLWLILSVDVGQLMFTSSRGFQVLETLKRVKTTLIP